jgi:hypothetical protein
VDFGHLTNEIGTGRHPLTTDNKQRHDKRLFSSALFLCIYGSFDLVRLKDIKFDRTPLTPLADGLPRCWINFVLN